MTPRHRILPIFVPHAGCPNDCVFCNQKRISGSLFPASGETVVQALEAIPPGAGLELAFYGGSFTAIGEELQIQLLEAAVPYRRDGRIASLRVSTRPDAVDEAALSRLCAYGVETIELGAQSLSDEVLYCSGRGHSAEDVVRAAQAVKAAGFSLVLQMMTGLPGDTPERAMETARQIIALRPDAVRIYPTVVVRDTALEAMWRKGTYREHTVEDAVSLCARLLPLFEAADIPVIRLGLNPSEELSGGSAVAGAYHPAFGELVRSRILLDKAMAMLAEDPLEGDVIIHVAPNRVSAMIGQHRSNVQRLQQTLAPRRVEVRGDPALAGDEIRLQTKET